MTEALDALRRIVERLDAAEDLLWLDILASVTELDAPEVPALLRERGLCGALRDCGASPAFIDRALNHPGAPELKRFGIPLYK